MVELAFFMLIFDGVDYNQLFSSYSLFSQKLKQHILHFSSIPLYNLFISEHRFYHSKPVLILFRK